MDLRNTGGRRCRRRTTRVEQGTSRKRTFEPVTDLVPSTLILRFFLTPNDFRGVRITLDQSRVFVRRERIDLLESRQRDILLA